MKEFDFRKFVLIYILQTLACEWLLCRTWPKTEANLAHTHRLRAQCQAIQPRQASSLPSSVSSSLHQAWLLVSDVIHFLRGDEEASVERIVFERQEQTLQFFEHEESSYCRAHIHITNRQTFPALLFSQHKMQEHCPPASRRFTSQLSMGSTTPSVAYFCLGFCGSRRRMTWSSFSLLNSTKFSLSLSLYLPRSLYIAFFLARHLSLCLSLSLSLSSLSLSLFSLVLSLAPSLSSPLSLYMYLDLLVSIFLIRYVPSNHFLLVPSISSVNPFLNIFSRLACLPLSLFAPSSPSSFYLAHT